MEKILEQLLQEEAELQFEQFNEQTAWQLGSLLVKHATAKNLPVTIDIMRGEQQLFHAALPGASADNDEWIKRKVRVVYRFGHSSFYIGQKLKAEGKDIEATYLIPKASLPRMAAASPSSYAEQACRCGNRFGPATGTRPQIRHTGTP
jgi:uncharacterized protein (UPF0303 family)